MRRGIPCQLECVICNSGELETTVHLMYRFRYTTQVWRGLEQKWGLKMMKSYDSIEGAWRQSWQFAKRRNGLYDAWLFFGIFGDKEMS